MNNQIKKDITIMWQMICNECKFNFEVQVPKGPTEEKLLKCPRCGSKHIQRNEPSSTVAAQCGG